MRYCGYSPLENKAYPMISVELNNKTGEEIAAFDIGWYDIDLGRGSKSAFIRLKNKFQVWLVEADFYDLSLDVKNWTYSSLWNLRFGRLISFNDISTDQEVMNLAKTLLNSYYTDIEEKSKASKLASVQIKAEYNNLLDIVFYKSSDDKYFIEYVFLTQPYGKHLMFFEKYVRGKFLQISKEFWEEIKNVTKSK